MESDILVHWFEGTHIAPEIIALHLGTAAAFGLIIGIDREMRDRPAGLRTPMLVAVASAMFAILAIDLTLEAAALADTAPSDPNIGRTSCRERVSQYVLIVVIAI